MVDILPLVRDGVATLEYHWAAQDDDGRMMENRVYLGDPRPTCGLCQACRAIPLGNGRYGCSIALPEGETPSRLPRCSA